MKSVDKELSLPSVLSVSANASLATQRPRLRGWSFHLVFPFGARVLADVIFDVD